MGTLTPGAARRHETTEAVRSRMARLLPTGPTEGLPRGPQREQIEEPTEALRGDEPPAVPAPAKGAARAGADAGGHAAGGAAPRPGIGHLLGDDGLPPPLPVPDSAGSGSPDPVFAELAESGVRPRRYILRPSLRAGLALDRRSVLGLAVLLLLAVAYAVQHFWLGRPHPVQIPLAAASTARAGPDDSAVPAPDGTGTAVVVVDVAGRVPAPGVRALPGGSRVADALRAAGGALPDADTRALNLARVLTDGEQILVGEATPGTPAAGGLAAPPAAGAPPGPPLSLNRATPEQLDSLPGVGPTLAQRIIAFRQSHGTFRSLEQLRQVSGIGERTFAELKPLLTL